MDKELSPSMKAASKAAACFKWDTSKYVVINSPVRRDVETGRLMLTKDRGNA